MNFEKLYQMQQQLDENINNLHQTTYESTLSKRIMAFYVELGEFANETRCFKYWSLKKPSEKDVCLEEYVDGLHFVLSIGLAINADIKRDYNVIQNCTDKTDTFLDVYNCTSIFDKNRTLDNYYNLMEKFLLLGMKFDFSFDDMIEAYYKKNQINYSRQENKY